MSYIVSINQITFTADNGIFADIQGTSRDLILDIIMSDNTVYSNALSLQWANMQDNLDFRSNSDAIRYNVKNMTENFLERL